MTEIISVTLSNGDVALFVNGDAILTLEADETGHNPASIGEYLAKALGARVQEVSMDVPLDDDWSWNDVYELLPPQTPSAVPAPDGMLVSLDGGVTYSPAQEGVRIIYQDILIAGEDGKGEVHINATHEGLITDIWTTREDPLDHNIGTDSIMIEDIVSRLVAEND